MHNAYERTVTSTYNLATWFLFATHHRMMIIFANLFFKIQPRMTQLLTGQETGFIVAYAQSSRSDCDLDLKPCDEVLHCDALSYHDNYLC